MPLERAASPMTRRPPAAASHITNTRAVPKPACYCETRPYLYTPGQWMPRQGEYCRLAGKPARAADAVAQGKEELHAALAEREHLGRRPGCGTGRA